MAFFVTFAGSGYWPSGGAFTGRRFGRLGQGAFEFDRLSAGPLDLRCSATPRTSSP